MIASGKVNEGDLLPSVRQMSSELSVASMTISKAYSQMEAAGQLERVRGLGMKILLPEITESLANRKGKLRQIAEQMAVSGFQLGLTQDQIVSVLKSVLKENQA